MTDRSACSVTPGLSSVLSASTLVLYQRVGYLWCSYPFQSFFCFVKFVPKLSISIHPTVISLRSTRIVRGWWLRSAKNVNMGKSIWIAHMCKTYWYLMPVYQTFLSKYRGLSFDLWNDVCVDMGTVTLLWLFQPQPLFYVFRDTYRFSFPSVSAS